MAGADFGKIREPATGHAEFPALASFPGRNWPVSRVDSLNMKVNASS